MNKTPPVPTDGLPEGERRRIREVCAFARKHLGSLRRRSGEDYVAHGCEVATTLAEMTDDPSLLAVAVLHDLPLHPDGTKLLAQSPLKPDERILVRSMHALRRLHSDESSRDLDTIITAVTGDARLLPLRMAHRLNDVRHLKRFDKKTQLQIARESLHIYSAIAGRLGMRSWRREMESACFRIVSPVVAANLERKLAQCRKLDLSCLMHTKKFLSRKLQQRGIKHELSFRVKTTYSIYRKMVLKHRRFEELTDRLALRIVVPRLEDCYLALGVVHASLHPIPGKLKDYIGSPKENGYRSVHTVVYPLPGVTELPIEIQIRTAEMDWQCEYGMARHSEYKDYLYALNAPSTRINLFQNLAALREQSRSPEQFEEALRTYFQDSHMPVFDAKNNLFHVRKPLTALDFACQTHGKRVALITAIRINGREQPLETPLRAGDTVEVRCGHLRTVKHSWTQLCRHKSSRRLIHELLEANATPPRRRPRQSSRSSSKAAG